MANELDDLNQLNDTENSVKTLEVWQKKLSDIQERTMRKQEQLTTVNFKFQDLKDQENEQQPMVQQQPQPGTTAGLQDDRQAQRKVRLLENKLDKLMLKLNEAVGIKKTYHSIVK